MPWGLPSSLMSRIQEAAERDKQEQAVKAQTSAFKGWARLGFAGPAIAQATTGQTPGQLNPLGMQYRQLQLQDDSVRPSNFFSKLGDIALAAAKRTQLQERREEREAMRAAERENERQIKEAERQQKILGSAAQVEGSPFAFLLENMAAASETARQQQAQRFGQGFGPGLAPPVPQEPGVFGPAYPGRAEAGAEAGRQFGQDYRGLQPEQQLQVLALQTVADEEGWTVPQLLQRIEEEEAARGGPGLLRSNVERRAGQLSMAMREPDLFQRGFIEPVVGHPMEGLLPESVYEAAGRVPVAGPGLENQLRYSTSPAGLATYGAAAAIGGLPALASYGLGDVAYIGGRTAAEPLPIPEYGKEAIGIGAGIATGLTALDPVTRAASREARLISAQEAAKPILRERQLARQAAREAGPEIIEGTAREVTQEVPQAVPREAAGVGPRAAMTETPVGEVQRVAREAVEAPPPRAAPELAAQAAEGPPVRPMPGEGMGGGAPLTARQVMERAGEEAEATVIDTLASPRRAVSEATGKHVGALAAAERRIEAWALDAYDQASESGLRIVRRASIEQATDEQVGIMERVFGDFDPATKIRSRAPVGQFPESQRPLIQQMYEVFDDYTTMLIAVDPNFQMRALPDYSPGMFVKRSPGAVRGRGRLPGFLRGRTSNSGLADILQRNPDLDLATWDPVELTKLAMADRERWMASVEMVRALRAQGIMMPAELAEAGWRRPNAPLFQHVDELKGMVMHPKAASEMEKLWSASLLDQNGVFRAAKNIRETLFQIKVLGGAFQGVDFTWRAEFGLGISELARGNVRGAVRSWFSPLRAVARSVSPALDRATTRFAAQNADLQALYRNGLSAGADPSIADRAIRGLGRFVPQTVGGQQIPGAHALQQVLEFVSGGAYHKFHRDMLEQAGLVKLQRYRRAGMALDDAAERAAKETNIFFSSIPNWQSAVKGATGRDIAKFPIFATGEFEGWFRIPVQQPLEFAGLVGGTVIAAELLNKFFTGAWLSEDQLRPYVEEPPRGPFGKVMPVSYNTHFLRPKLPWKGPDGRDLYLDLLGQADTPFRWALDPWFAAQTRLGQFPRAAMDIQTAASGEAPPFGERVESVGDAARFAAQQVAPIPLAGLSGTEVGRIGYLGAGVQTGGLNISAESLRERRRDVIAQEYEAGHLRGSYDQAPLEFSDLEGDIDEPESDKGRLNAKYPSLFEEAFARSQEETLGTISGRQEAAITSEDLARARDTLNTELDRIGDKVDSGGFGELGELETRQAAAEAIQAARTAYGTNVADAIARNPDAFGDEREYSAKENRIWNKYLALQRKFENRDTEEDWAAYDAAFEAAFTESDERIIRERQRAGDHDLEVAYQDASAIVGDSGYYDLEEGDAREIFRQRNPQVDGTLWALGRTSCVRGPRSRTHAISALRDLYGISINGREVKVCD